MEAPAELPATSTTRAAAQRPDRIRRPTARYPLEGGSLSDPTRWSISRAALRSRPTRGVGRAVVSLRQLEHHNRSALRPTGSPSLDRPLSSGLSIDRRGRASSAPQLLEDLVSDGPSDSGIFLEGGGPRDPSAEPEWSSARFTDDDPCLACFHHDWAAEPLAFVLVPSFRPTTLSVTIHDPAIPAPLAATRRSRAPPTSA